jgi:hypothetical protein
MIKKIIWIRDISKRNMVIMENLGIKYLICLNEATNLKFCWYLMKSEEKWALLLGSIAIIGVQCIHHHIFSLIWSSIYCTMKKIMLVYAQEANSLCQTYLMYHDFYY